MNYEKAMLEISERLGGSKLFVAMKEWQTKVDVYPTTCDAVTHKVSPKRVRIIEEASNMLYPLHTAFSKPISDYSNSIVLISNEIPVKFMIQEAAEFAHMLQEFRDGIETFETPINKSINGVKDIQELQAYYKDFKFTKKQVLGLLIQDIHQYSEKYGFEFNKAEIVEGFESSYLKNFEKTEILCG